MKGFRLFLLLVGSAVVGLGGAMVVTNPNQTAYDDYATGELTTYLKSQGNNLCDDAPGFLQDLLQNRCESLISSVLDGNQSRITSLISQNTDRKNYYVLSLYHTELSIHESLPSYEFDTVGVFNRFYTYRAEKQ
jgi:hypothetical protein